MPDTDFGSRKKELPVSITFHIAAGFLREKLLRLSVLRRRSVSDNLHGILARSNSGALWQPTDGRPCHVRLYPEGPRFVATSLPEP